MFLRTLLRFFPESEARNGAYECLPSITRSERLDLIFFKMAQSDWEFSKC